MKVSLVTLGEHPCSYLPGRLSESRALWADRIPPALYHRFMDAGFRRSGRLLYQPVCRGCRACVSIRVPVATFRPSKSQRRCRRRNDDLRVTIAGAVATDEKYDLYRRYVVGRHQRSAEDENRDSFERFLYDSPVDTIEFAYRNRAGRLLAIGLCDASPDSFSSVYFYFDPEESKRGLGTYGALYEIEAAARLGMPHTTSDTGSTAAVRCSTRPTSGRRRCCTPTAAGGRWSGRPPRPTRRRRGRESRRIRRWSGPTRLV